MSIKKFKILVFGIGILLLINLIVLGYWFVLFNGNVSEDSLKVVFLNVGQGDAALIQTSQQDILVDGGPDKNIIYKLDKYIPFYDREIDLMILTHLDSDHLTGLVEVLKRYPVKKIISNGLKNYDSIALEWERLIQEKNIPQQIADIPLTILLDEQTLIEFLWPSQDLIKESKGDDNFTSLVFKLTHGNNKFLFTGDVPKEVEEILAATENDLKADVLKAGHHGSKYSSTMEFLSKVKPKYGVISCGENNFGHPSLRVLKNLENIRAEILRTDQLGDVIFLSDGQELTLTSKK
ncbi:MBL fold metallo-hydrolase [Patescibacteria group bacterium]|nr:MBL fold metallo-hydrolase [Patescibacteria group bacterium]